MYEIRNVKYKNILDIDNLKIPEKKVTSIVGKSGSGKTTLLRLLNKLISCDTGSILFKDKSLKEIDSVELRRKVIMLPQQPIIFEGSIRKNLLIGLEFSEKELLPDDRLNEILKLVHLDKSLDSEAEKLSGGEKQRVALGRVILMDPEVLLLDEPSSALDDLTEDKIIEFVANYSRDNNKTLILVTHSKDISKKYSDIEIVIEAGRISSTESKGV
jgi:putative ABC transport system ATP-binding protein